MSRRVTLYRRRYAQTAGQTLADAILQQHRTARETGRRGTVAGHVRPRAVPQVCSRPMTPAKAHRLAARIIRARGG